MPAARIQPQGAPRPNRQLNPSFLITTAGGSPIDCVRGTVSALSSGALIGVDRNGKNLKFDGSTGHATFPTNPAYNILGPLSLVWHGVITDYANFNMLVTRSSGNGISNNPFELRTDASTGYVALTRGAANYAQYRSNIAVPTGTPSVVIVTQESVNGACRIIINGIESAISIVFNANGYVGPATPNSEPLYIGRRADGNYHKGSTSALAGFPRILSNAEIHAISANPAMLFEGQAPMLYAASAPVVPTVDATPGTIAASGLPASVSLPTAIAAAVGALSVAGRAASISLPTVVSASAAPVNATGRPATVTLSTVISASAAPVTLAGLAATVSTGSAISAATGTVATVGQNATIATTTAINASAASVALAGLAATIVTGAAISASVGTVNATGRSAAIIVTESISATTANVSASGLLAAIQSGAAISATTGQITATGRNASIVTGVSIQCGVASVNATGRAAFIPVATFVSCVSGAATAIGLTASIALDRPAPLPSRHNMYRGQDRTRSVAGHARTRIYKGLS